MPINSRTKGHGFERWVAKELRELGLPTKRGVDQAQAGGVQADVEGTPFWLELKRGRQPNIRAAMKQAREATDGRDPVVITKADREEVLVTMPFDTFKALLVKL